MNRPIRIIPKLDIKNGLLIKGINLEGLRVLGDPYDFAKFYYECGADEIFYLDNVATLYGTNNLTKFVTRTSKNLYVPLTAGGGIKNVDDIKQLLKSGADKITINSQIIKNPNIIIKAKKIFGSSTLSAIIEVVKIKSKYFISYSNGRDLINKDPIKWAKFLEKIGVGELIVTSVNYEGLGNGFDINIIKKISNSVNIPVIAHGGAGNFKHVLDVIKQTKISGVAVSSLLHYACVSYFKKKMPGIGNTSFLESLKKSNKKENVLRKLKKFLKKNKINVRL